MRVLPTAIFRLCQGGLCRFARGFAAPALLFGALGGALPGVALPASPVFPLAIEAARDNARGALVHYWAHLGDELERTVVSWVRLSQGRAHWSEYLSFLREHPAFPSRKRLRLLAEQGFDAQTDDALILPFFARDDPQTPQGWRRYLQALEAAGYPSYAGQIRKRLWLEEPLDPATQALWAQDSELGKAAWQRLDFLIWHQETALAEALLALSEVALTAEQREEAGFRLGLQNGAEDGLERFKALPQEAQHDVAQAYALYQWHIRMGQWEAAEAVLAAQSPEALIHPELWAERRDGFARQAMRAGRSSEAYRIAAEHGMALYADMPLSERADYADAEWMAGYVALEYLKDPDLAVRHFSRQIEAVTTPISLSRGWYWKGRAEAAAGRLSMAHEAFEIASSWRPEYYAQLAAERLGSALTPNPADAPAGDLEEISDTPITRAAFSLYELGETAYARAFFAHLAAVLPAEELRGIGRIAMRREMPEIALMIAKEAAGRGVIWVDLLYPEYPLPTLPEAVPAELVLAIIRQESGFIDHATSRAGAAGLMQIMPQTGKGLALRYGLGDEVDLYDPKTNITLGAAYLAELLDRYNGSYPLAIAAYNAGPRRVDLWLTEIGDPRGAERDPITWVEHIPYRETRSYVMRVMSALAPYQQKIHGQSAMAALSLFMAQTH